MGKNMQGRGRLRVIHFPEKSEIYHVNGVPVLNGLFGVPKKKENISDGRAVLRMICNAIPSNACQVLIVGDIRSLPYFAQWTGIRIENGMVLCWSEPDLSAAFYIFRMEPSWFQLQALAKPVSGKFAAQWRKEVESEDEVYPAVTVMMMGWQSACGVLQHAHRRLCFAPPPLGAGLDPSREVRKDMAMPAGSEGDSRNLFSIYLDGFSQAELHDLHTKAKLPSESPELQKLLEVWDYWGIPNRPDKSVYRETEAISLGCRLDGVLGILAPPREVMSELMSLTEWVCRLEQGCKLKVMQILGGRWVRCFQLRRELSGVFGHFWAHLGDMSAKNENGKVLSKRMPRKVGEDLMLAVMLLPLCRTDLRAKTSAMVIATDASEKGFGVCRSMSLAPSGLAEESVRSSLTMGKCDRMGLIEVFAGIGGFARALEHLGVMPSVHAAIELDASCRGLLKTAWPDVMLYVDVEQVYEDQIRTVVHSGGHVDTWVIAGGFPCQQHSSLNANRQGLAGSTMHRHIMRIVCLVRSLVPHAQVHFMAECVQSMEITSAEFISQEFGVRPLAVCPFPLSPARRPRFYWVSWSVHVAKGVRVRNMGYYDEVLFDGPQVPLEEQTWIRSGWKRTVTGALPTFVRGRPSEQPGYKPAGLEEADASAVARWKQDSHRFPPYQYAWCCGMIKKGVWRTPDVHERELIMGFKKDHTITIRTRRQTMEDEEEALNARLSALGNSVHTGVVAFLLGKLLYDRGIVGALPTTGVVAVTERANLMHACKVPEMRMVCQLLRHQSHKGREIRRPSQYGTPHCFPWESVEADWWLWKTIISGQWKHEAEHINVLELRAFLTGLSWRLRSKANLRTRAICLLDSQVVLGALAKGRSASRRMGHLVARADSLMLAASFMCMLGYVASPKNPADAPSRS